MLLTFVVEGAAALDLQPFARLMARKDKEGRITSKLKLGVEHDGV